jgi:hypothetical protein
MSMKEQFQFVITALLYKLTLMNTTCRAQFISLKEQEETMTMCKQNLNVYLM